MLNYRRFKVRLAEATDASRRFTSLGAACTSLSTSLLEGGKFDVLHSLKLNVRQPMLLLLLLLFCDATVEASRPDVGQKREVGASTKKGNFFLKRPSGLYVNPAS